VFMLSHLTPGWVGGVLTAIILSWLVIERELEATSAMTWWLDSCLLLKLCFLKEEFAVHTNNVSTLLRILKKIWCDESHVLLKLNLNNRNSIARRWTSRLKNLIKNVIKKI
jgi:hypothetical protein